jgi:hypothetical protein
MRATFRRVAGMPVEFGRGDALEGYSGVNSHGGTTIDVDGLLSGHGCSTGGTIVGDVVDNGVLTFRPGGADPFVYSIDGDGFPANCASIWRI